MQIWGLMDAKLDWSALNSLFEYFELAGVQVDLVIASLIEIKDMVDQLRQVR